jgi:hypothetical protein
MRENPLGTKFAGHVNLTTAGLFNWFGVAPDDSPIMLRDAGTQDVYALDWEEP